MLFREDLLIELADSGRERGSSRSVTKSWDQALNTAVYQEKRPTICFLCLGNRNLPGRKRLNSFSTPDDGQQIIYNPCKMSPEHKVHFQSHAMRVHGTVS